MRRRTVALLLTVALAGTSASAATAGGTSGTDREGGRGEERIDVRVVPLPASVTGPRFPWWSADGSRLLFSATPAGGTRVELMSVAPDGSGLACLTCGRATDVAKPLLKPIAFPDNRRVVVRVGDQSPLRAADRAVLECTPSVVRCDRAELVPIAVPAAGDTNVVQDQRELKVAPDGRHVGFTQVRASADGEPVMISIVARLRRAATAYELDGARVVSTRGELKGFTPDGRAATVMAFAPAPYEEGNPDVVRVDLATGKESRLTHHADYDEPVEFSPDGRWMAVGSGRGAGLTETVSQVRRPSFLGPALEQLVASLYVTHRPEILEPWLVSVRGEARGETGRRLGTGDAGYDGRAIPNWSPHGTAIAFWEGRGTAFETDPTGTRLVVADLPDRRPQRAHPPRTLPASRWAPELAGFVPPAPPVLESRAGRRGGRAEVTVERSPDRLAVTVTYRAFSDDGAWVVDGTERAVRAGGRTAYTSDLTLSGRHHGRLRADAVISLTGIEGSIVSEVDGRRLSLPRPAGTS